MTSELRFALRTLRKNPGPTAVMVSTLGVAVAAATIVYSTIDIVVHLLPIADRERIVFIASSDPRRGESRLGVSVADLVDLVNQSTTVEAFAAFSLDSTNLTGIDVPVRVTIARATSNLPQVWGLQPELGRLFQPEDGGVGAERVAVLTYPFWAAHFASNQAVVGSKVLLNDQPHTIVGILRPNASIGALRDRDLLVPTQLDAAATARDDRNLFVTGRLKAGVTRQVAAEVIFDDLLGTYMLVVLLGSVAVMALCLAAAGIYGLVSYVVTQRSREIGVRMALGAAPQAVRRMVVWQGSMPAAGGGIVGLAAAVIIAFATAGSNPDVDVRNPTGYGLVVSACSWWPRGRATSPHGERAASIRQLHCGPSETPCRCHATLGVSCGGREPGWQLESLLVADLDLSAATGLLASRCRVSPM